MLVTTNALKIAGRVCDDIEVEIDLTDIDEDILIDFLEASGDLVVAPAHKSVSDDAAEMSVLIDAFKLGDPQAVEKCKRFLEDVTGRTI